MNINKHDVMVNYISQCPHINDLFFNFATAENGATVINTATNEYEAEKYIDGSALKWYDFSLVQFLPVSTDPNNDTNTDALYAVEQLMLWIESQEEVENYPDFGEKCEVQEISVLQETPTAAGQDQKSAKYMFSCRVEYIERK